MNDFQLSVFAARAPWMVHGPSIAAWLGRLEVSVPHAKSAGKNFLGDSPPQMIIENGLAIIPISGPLIQNASFLERGFGAADYADIAANLDEASNTPGLRGIILKINSPGGTCNGCEELAAKIQTAKSSIPIMAFTDSMAASAAYWLGGSASKFFATPSATVGSVGTVLQHVDMSRMFDSAGIKVEQFTSGKFKGAGNRAIPLTGDQREYFQEIVNEAANVFKAAIKANRPRVTENEMQGQTFSGRAAMRNGMVDSNLNNFTELLNQLAGTKASSTGRSNSAVTQTFQQLVFERVRRGALKSDAIRDVVSKHPVEHLQYLQTGGGQL